MPDDDLFARERGLPEGHGEDGIVQWHVFRSREQAEAFLPQVRLAEGQRLTGGRTRDSIGTLWWVGVQVDDLENWGDRLAVNKRGASP